MDPNTNNHLDNLEFANRWFTARGPFLAVLLALALFGNATLTWWLCIDHARNRADEHRVLLLNQQRLIEEIQVLAWMASIPYSERPRLRPPPGIDSRRWEGVPAP